jgi:hypothetical protein
VDQGDQVAGSRGSYYTLELDDGSTIHAVVICTGNLQSADTRRRLQESLVLVHGGMAQNVGPILEMVTEKYLLRSEAEWEATPNG